MQSLEVVRRIYAFPAKQYQLDEEAIETFSAYEHDKQVQAQQARLDAQGALYGKSAGKVLRVALPLHLLQLVLTRQEYSLEVPASRLQLAIDLVDQLDACALGCHEQAAADADAGGVSSLMRRIHTLARNAKGAVSWAQLRQQMNSREKKGILAGVGSGRQVHLRPEVLNVEGQIDVFGKALDQPLGLGERRAPFEGEGGEQLFIGPEAR